MATEWTVPLPNQLSTNPLYFRMGDTATSEEFYVAVLKLDEVIEVGPYSARTNIPTQGQIIRNCLLLL